MFDCFWQRHVIRKPEEASSGCGLVINWGRECAKEALDQIFQTVRAHVQTVYLSW